MSIIEALILGLVQGVTEFIPVSSSGHLLLLHELFGTDEGTLAFDVILHVGTLLALVVFFRKDILELAQNIGKSTKQGRLARLLVAATVPAATAGLLFADVIDDNLRSPLVVAIMLGVVALLMLFADSMGNEETNKEIKADQGLTIGLAQAIALIPGTSRSGITITTGVLLGLGRQQAARFSFLLAIPIIAGSAAGILLKDSVNFSGGNWQLFVGVAAAFVSGLGAIQFLLGIIGRVGLKPFAYYRLLLAAAVLLILV